MNVLQYISNTILLATKRRQLKAERHWIWQLEDQKAAAEGALKRARAREKQLQSEIFALQPPDEIIRRGAQA